MSKVAPHLSEGAVMKLGLLSLIPARSLFVTAKGPKTDR
jgi:hypothetical protein